MGFFHLCALVCVQSARHAPRKKLNWCSLQPRMDANKRGFKTWFSSAFVSVLSAVLACPASILASASGRKAQAGQANDRCRTRLRNGLRRKANRKLNRMLSPVSLKTRVALSGKIGVYSDTNSFGSQTFVTEKGGSKLLTS